MSKLFVRKLFVLGLLALGASPALAQNAPQGPANPAGVAKLDLATQAHLSYPGDVTGYMDVTYSAVRGYRPLKLDLYVPASGGARPAVVWIHGGGWAGGSPRAALGPYPDWRVVLASLGARGYVVVGATYRFSGEAKFPAAIEDIKAGVR
jgi:acetyl esterase/lipase